MESSNRSNWLIQLNTTISLVRVFFFSCFLRKKPMASPKPPNMETSCSELLFCLFSGDSYVSEKRYEVREIASLIS